MPDRYTPLPRTKMMKSSYRHNTEVTFARSNTPVSTESGLLVAPALSLNDKYFEYTNEQLEQMSPTSDSFNDIGHTPYPPTTPENSPTRKRIFLTPQQTPSPTRKENRRYKFSPHLFAARPEDIPVKDLTKIRKQIQNSAPNIDRDTVINSLNDFLDRRKKHCKGKPKFTETADPQSGFNFGINHKITHDFTSSTLESLIPTWLNPRTGKITAARKPAYQATEEDIDRVKYHFTTNEITQAEKNRRKAEQALKDDDTDSFHSMEMPDYLKNFPSYNDPSSWFGKIFNVISKTSTLSGISVIALLNYCSRRTRFSKYLLFICLSALVLKAMTNLGKNSQELLDLLPAWEQLNTDISSESDPTDPISMEDISPQDGGGDFSVFTSLVTVLVTATTGYKAKNKLSEALLSATKTNDTQFKNVSGILIFVSTQLHNFFAYSMGDDSISKYFYIDAVSDAEVASLIDRISTFIATVYSGKPSSNLYCTQVYETYIDEGKSLMKRLDKHSYDYKCLSKACDKLLTFNQEIKNIRHALNGPRVEPVGVLVRGRPGISKSILMRRLGEVIAPLTIPKAWKKDYEENSKDFHFNKPNDKFFDGHTNKAWVLYCDDLFQKREVPGDPDSDSCFVIKAINPEPFPLMMSTTHDKGRHYMTEPFAICSTNLTNKALLQSVCEPEAVMRRFHIDISAKIAKKYQDENGARDDSKLPKVISSDGHVVTELPNDFWDITMILKHGDTEDPPIENVTIDTVILTMIKLHKQRERYFYINKQTNKHNTERIIDRMQKYMAGEITEEEVNAQSYFEEENVTLDQLVEKWRRTFAADFHMMVDYCDICMGLERLDLYSEGMLIEHFRNVPQSLRNKYFRALDNNKDFKHAVKCEYMRLIEEGYNPVFNRPDEEVPRDYDYMARCSREEMQKIWDEPFKFIKENILMLTFMGVLLGTAMYWIAGFFRSVINPEAQSIDYSRMGHRVGNKSAKAVRLSHMKHNIIDIHPQGFDLEPIDFDTIPKIIPEDFGCRNNATDIAQKVFNKYFFVIYVIENTRRETGERRMVRLGHCMNVCGQIFLMPFHFMYTLHKISSKEDYTGAHLVFRTPLRNSGYNVSLEDVKTSYRTTDSASDNDVCIVKLKCAQMGSIGVLKYMLNEQDLERLNTTSTFTALLAGTFNRNKLMNQFNLRVGSVTAKVKGDPLRVNDNWHPDNPYYHLNRTIEYGKSVFSGGDCGSMLLATDANFENRIILGMHVAGNHDRGYSTLLTQESVLSLINETYGSQHFFVDEEIPDYFIPTDDIHPQNSMEPIGTLQPIWVPGDVTHSKLKKSEFHHKLPPPYNFVETLPAKLKPFENKEGETIYPHLLALSKYGKDPTAISVKFVERAKQSYEQLLINRLETKQKYRKVVPMRIAMHSFGHVGPIPSDTSSGFPMNLQHQPDLMKELTQALAKLEPDIEEIDKCYERIAQSVQAIISLYKQRIRPWFLYKGTLKDEKRKHSKVMQGLTRLFCGCPKIYTILTRMYMGQFISDFVEANLDVGSAIGVNAYSVEWDSLARKLLQFSQNHDEENIKAGDYSSYDTSHMPQLMNAVHDIIQNYYGYEDEEDTMIRTFLFVEITNSRHIYYGNVYEWVSALPSGTALTPIINTIINHLLFRITYQLADLPIETFNKKVYLCGLGDDNVCSTHPSVSGVFNELTLPILMKSCGMVYTTELKEEAVVPGRKLSEVEFLKRTFSYDKTIARWVAPLRMQAIAEMMNWTKKGREGDQIAVNNILNALREVSLHDKKTFDKWKAKLLDLKSEYYPFVEVQGEIPTSHASALEEVLSLPFYLS